jgi:hypothetical protein
VAIADPDPAPSAVALCRSLMAELPEEVLDEGRRRVEPGSLSAAWGNPTITLRCGVPRPPTLAAGSPCFEVNSVGWFAEEASGGYLFTTIGRAVFVEVGVPAAYAPEATALVDLADAVSEHVPMERPCL